jgi:DNA repair protein RadC
MTVCLLLILFHPSGDPTPSKEDIEVTTQLVEAGKILEIELVDHLIIGHHQRFVSLKERIGR